MRQAAVGFQCPSCVSEGAKSTRSGRTAYGGLRSANPGLTSAVLIGVNVMVWVAVLATGWRASPLVDRLALLVTGRCTEEGGFYPGVTSAAVCAERTTTTWYAGVADGAWWQLATSMFAHVDVWHIGFNMLALWVLGPQVELALGRVRFLALFLLSGLSGSVAVYWLSGVDSATLGASGAVFGLMAALLVAGHKVGGNIQPLLMWVGLNVAITVLGSSFISWQGHLGGFVGGLLLMGLFAYAPRTRRTTWQAAGVALLAVALVVAVVARTAVLA